MTRKPHYHAVSATVCLQCDSFTVSEEIGYCV